MEKAIRSTLEPYSMGAISFFGISAACINTECLNDFGSTQFEPFAPAALRCALVVTDCQ